ncbi:NADH dehydrogenase [ubiquinone] 1 beta subcomplex subunit 8 [Trinorchestia longiramus]|nr:NADH dehydrogenase [ubiquinone] 1 beta subcomplex subunit 8 [Trinorchestia longiramus]
MAVFARTAISLKKLTRNSVPLLQCARNAAHWNDDWKPGPYPKTEAERVAAARKYGLLPEDYEPYPDDGMGLGDYPKLPVVSAESKDPYEPWDFPEYRRNFGEPLHVDFDMYGLDRVKYEHTDPLSPQGYVLAFFSMVGSILVLAYIFQDTLTYEMKPKQWPSSGEKHYTFEPAN